MKSTKLTLISICTVMLSCLTLWSQTYHIGDKIDNPTRVGPYYRMSNLELPPVPLLPLGHSAYYLGTVGGVPIFGYDDWAFRYGESSSQQSQTMEEQSGSDPGPMDGPTPYDYGAAFYIEVLKVTNNLAYLALHNVRSNSFGQILSSPNLPATNWSFGPFLQNTNGTNQIFFAPLPTLGVSNMFYRGIQGYPVVSIEWGADAVETNSYNNDYAFSGSANVKINRTLSTNLTIQLKIGGTASNGIDYDYIPDTVEIAAGDTATSIQILPVIEDHDPEYEYVTISLVETNGYIVDPNKSSATIDLLDDPFEPVLYFDLGGIPVGIDYHQPSNSLIVSFEQPGSFLYYPNFGRVYTNGIDTNAVDSLWTGIQAMLEEVKLTTVKATANGFTNGEVFFCNDQPGGIGWISADGTRSNINWLTLPNETHRLRGSLYIDQSGSFGGDLIVVTGDALVNGVVTNGVWLVTANKQATKIASILSYHLEGVITLTNDVQRWGPWAGKIITGDESAVDTNGLLHPLIYTISTNGIVTTFDLGIAPEDFDIIPPNQNLYCGFLERYGILKVPSYYFTNNIGDLLITQEGFFLPRGELFIVHWDGTKFTKKGLAHQIYQFEHVTFAPIDFPRIDPL